jgi:hypothetical protein
MVCLKKADLNLRQVVLAGLKLRVGLQIQVAYVNECNRYS